MVERELSLKAKSIYIPTLAASHEVWEMTERIRSRVHVAKTFTIVALYVLQAYPRLMEQPEEREEWNQVVQSYQLGASLWRYYGHIQLGRHARADLEHSI